MLLFLPKLCRALALLILLFLVFPSRVAGQESEIWKDSTGTYHIPVVSVTESYATREVAASIPLQEMTLKKIQSLNALQLSDAVKHFAGITVKDYGGIGGLKTVSIRSLGANHTAVGYDGITLSDCQTGQIDISRFSLDNVDRLSLSIGQDDEIFRPARFFASAGVLDIRTLTPVFEENESLKGKVSLKGGSFGLCNPSVRIEPKINTKWCATLNGEWMSAHGRYPYDLHYGGSKDSVSHEKRRNSDVWSLRGEGELFGNFSTTEQWRTKIYFYQSFRELPNATTFYNDQYESNLKDRVLFVQSQYKKELGAQWVIHSAVKYNWSYQRYHDEASLATPELGVNTNSYTQEEYYLTGSLLWRAFDHLSFSLNTDGAVNTLSATGMYQFAYPTRYSWLTALASKYESNRLTATASLLGTLINEDTKMGECAGNHRKISPFVSLSYKPFNEEFYLRAFYKDIFRLPSFNDLYYSRVGNPDLKPENASQMNLGITWSHVFGSTLSLVSVTVDGYHNRVSDKIVAIPTKNIFIWTMMNLGKVESKGVDLTLTTELNFSKKTGLTLSGNYTYQRALDITGNEGESGKVYKHQIAYTPRVAASGQAALETPWVNLSYAVVYSGARYVLGQNIHENRLPGYADHSLSANRKFLFGKKRVTFLVEMLNMLDKNYAIVKYFPMPGRSFRGTIKLEL